LLTSPDPLLPLFVRFWITFGLPHAFEIEFGEHQGIEITLDSPVCSAFNLVPATLQLDWLNLEPDTLYTLANFGKGSTLSSAIIQLSPPNVNSVISRKK
jgi:hypothetical protein